jgi:hypothetical protein
MGRKPTFTPTPEHLSREEAEADRKLASDRDLPAFTCTPTRAWDGDGAIRCAEV